MKKRLLFLLLVVSFISIGCAPETQVTTQDEISKVSDAPQNIQEPQSVQETEQPTAEETPIEEGITLPVEPGSAVHDVEEPEVKLFNPALTYPDAYNGPLYATWEHMTSNDANEYFNNLERNGINFIIGAFSIFGQQNADSLTNADGLGKAIYLVQKYQNRIIPVFSTGMGGASEKSMVGDKLTSMYKDALDSSKSIAGNILQGFGEIETQEWKMPHNDQKIMGLFSLADSNGLFVMFHPVPGQKSSIKSIIETYPDTIFVIHMFPEDFSKDRPNIIDLMKTHDNFYFSIDADHMLFDGRIGLLYKYDDDSISSAKSSFISDFDSKHLNLLNTAVSRYKPLVDAVPEKVVWGTEIGPTYNFEPEVYDRVIKYSRMFIARLNPEHQENVAYKNALRVFGQGARLEKKIDVIDASAWLPCTSKQMNECESKCESAGSEDSLENEVCLDNCVARLKCVDIY